MTDKSIHAHEKTIRKEHDASKALNKAQHAHEARLNEQNEAAKAIEVHLFH